MITITLQFNTQEEAVAYLTGATKAKAEATQAIEKVAKVEAPKPAKLEKPAPTPTAALTTTAPAQTEPAVASPSEISYDVVQKAITNKAKTDRETAIAVLAKFGVKKGTELKPEQYADVLAELA